MSLELVQKELGEIKTSLEVKAAEAGSAAAKAEIEKQLKAVNDNIAKFKGFSELSEDDLKKAMENVKSLTDAIDAIQLKMKTNGGAAECKTIAEEVKENKAGLQTMLKTRGTEFEMKADTVRASITSTPSQIVLPGIGQLARIARSLYNLFSKVSISRGNHNGTIKYLDWDEATTVKAAAMIAEGAAFPESTAKFQAYSLSLKKVGDTLPVSEEFFEDEETAAGELSMFIHHNVESEIDDQIVNGDNTGENLKGLLTSVNAYTAAASAIADANIYDLVVKVEEDIVKTTGSKYKVNFAAMNKTTINRLLLKKDTNNNYLFPPSHPIYGMIVEDNNIANNVLVVGDSRFGRIYELGGVTLSSGMIDDQYNKDLITLKARKRLLFLIRNSDKAGFRKVTDIDAALVTLAS